ncbi:MAG: hypothetical protein NTZ74_08895 [Chloroflexi bacterium]|nr:hypothetical protein [Chloroflexota bacterium]
MLAIRTVKLLITKLEFFGFKKRRNIKMNSEKIEIIILDPEITEKVGTHIVYVLAECDNPDCDHHRWGITPINGAIKPDQLICTSCFAQKLIR